MSVPKSQIDICSAADARIASNLYVYYNTFRSIVDACLDKPPRARRRAYFLISIILLFLGGIIMFELLFTFVVHFIYLLTAVRIESKGPVSVCDRLSDTLLREKDKRRLYMGDIVFERGTRLASNTGFLIYANRQAKFSTMLSYTSKSYRFFSRPC